MSAIGQEAFRQIGGHRFVAMTGARDLTVNSKGFTCRLPSTLTKAKGTHMSITLDPSDTYTLRYERVRRVKGAPYIVAHLLEERSNVYACDLRMVFEDLTGLRTYL